jgi:hypothetical protein
MKVCRFYVRVLRSAGHSVRKCSDSKSKAYKGLSPLGWLKKYEKKVRLAVAEMVGGGWGGEKGLKRLQSVARQFKVKLICGVNK